MPGIIKNCPTFLQDGAVNHIVLMNFKRFNNGGPFSFWKNQTLGVPRQGLGLPILYYALDAQQAPGMCLHYAILATNSVKSFLSLLPCRIFRQNSL